jgi:hypothetical protein
MLDGVFVVTPEEGSRDLPPPALAAESAGRLFALVHGSEGQWLVG